MDAAIAANATLGVMEPDMNGMGGDLFAIYWDAKTGKALRPERQRMGSEGAHHYAFESHGRNANAPGRNRYGHGSGRGRGMEQAARTFRSTGVERSVCAGDLLRGKRLRGSGTDQHGLAGSRAKLQKDPESRRVFLVHDEAPQFGEVFKNPDVAKTLRLLAAGGPQEFYKGEIAKSILATSHELHGTMTAEDLSEFSAEWVEPISTTYRGWKVYELPPNGQGMAALEMLNIMEQFSPAKSGPLSSEEIHKRIEAMKLAYADLARYNADPRFAKVPVAGLLSKEYAKQRAQLIDPQKAELQYGCGAAASGRYDLPYSGGS